MYFYILAITINRILITIMILTNKISVDIIIYIFYSVYIYILADKSQYY
jgi:hypothetical protein